MRIARITLGFTIISCLLVAAFPATPVLALVGNINIYPATGSPASQVSVTGTGFTAGSTYTVHFGATNVLTGTVDAAGTLGNSYFTVPPLPRAVYNVTVTTSGGDTSNTLTFSVTPAIALDIESGGVGDIIKVSGVGFAAGAAVSISIDGGGGILANSDALGSFTGAPIVVPLLPPGRHTIAANDGFAYTLGVTFRVVPKITVTAITPNVGSPIIISVTGFASSSPITFYVDGVGVNPTGPVRTDGNGSFNNASLNIPPLSQGSHVFMAQDASGNSATASLSIKASLTIKPQTGPPGAMVQVTGNGFSANSAINLAYNGATVSTSPAAVATDANGSFSASFVVPTGSSGTYTIEASDSTNTASAAFTVTAYASLNPTVGTVGSSIAIKGTNLIGGASILVRYDGSQVASGMADASGAFSATFKAPNSQSGNHQVTLTDNLNRVTLTFTIVPGINLRPASGYVGSNVAVNGTRFTVGRPVAIKFDNIQVATTTPGASGAFSATFKAPNGQSDNHEVTATDNLNTTTLTFEILPSVSLSAASGYVGTSITVNGVGFGAGRTAVINYDNIQTATATTDADGAFSATFKASASRSGNHQVTANDSVNTATLPFTILPSVSLSPASGYIGSSVGVNGAGFTTNGNVVIRYDNNQVATIATDASGTFAATFNAPASKGGNHQVSITDSINTVTADFAMDSIAPPAPALQQPADSTKAEALPAFSWISVSDPSGVTYTLQIASDVTFSNVVVEKKGLTTLGYTLTEQEKLKSGSYYWRVKAIDGASNESPWEAPRSFCVGFVLSTWGLCAIFAAVVLLVGLLGLWLGFWIGRKTYSGWKSA